MTLPADHSLCASTSCPLRHLCARSTEAGAPVGSHRSVTVYLWTVTDEGPDCGAFVPREVREDEG